MTPLSLTYFRPMLRLLAIAFMTSCVGGCAVYQYDVIKPEPFAGRVGGVQDKVIDLNPLTYWLRSVDNRLVIRIFNPTADPIAVVGHESAVVDPDGQSHPLRSQTIAPGAYIKLILPPRRPTAYESGPSIGFGFGGIVGGRGYHRGGFYSSSVFYDEPRYYTLYDESDATYWEWNGKTDTRLILVYQRGPRTFQDNFLLHRHKKS